MTLKPLERILTATPASDGGGVKLFRILGPEGMRALDPFLMLDEFGSESADDYIAGFPPHPHRGFETVTYMLEGRMLHEDHLGNRGLLESGGVQWMTAGRGVIHSEMPQQDSGRMRGLQLWINLPAAEKMKDPSYRHIPADRIPSVTLAEGARVRLVAGSLPMVRFASVVPRRASRPIRSIWTWIYRQARGWRCRYRRGTVRWSM